MVEDEKVHGHVFCFNDELGTTRHSHKMLCNICLNNG